MYAIQHTWCLSQARINWRVAAGRASGIKMIRMVEVGAPISVDMVASSRIVGASAFVILPLHQKTISYCHLIRLLCCACQIGSHCMNHCCQCAVMISGWIQHQLENIESFCGHADRITVTGFGDLNLVFDSFKHTPDNWPLVNNSSQKCCQHSFSDHCETVILTVHLCMQHDGHDAGFHAGPSVATETQD